MIKANHSHKNLVVAILTQSFEHNPSVNYIIKQDRKRLERVMALMSYSFEICSLFGEVWLTDDLKGCALLLYPHKKRITFKSVYYDLVLILHSIGIGRIALAVDREGKIKKVRPDGPSVYLWFIGIKPDAQNKGLGSEFLKQVLVHARNLELPIYLETSVHKNLDWYKRFGFQVYNRLSFGHTLHFLSHVP